MKFFQLLGVLSLIIASSCSSSKASLSKKDTEKALIRYVPTAVKEDLIYVHASEDLVEDVKIYIDNGVVPDMEPSSEDVWMLCATTGKECIYRIYRHEGSDSTLITGQKFLIIEPVFELKFTGVDNKNRIGRENIGLNSRLEIGLDSPETELNHTILGFDFLALVDGKEVRFNSKQSGLTAEMIGMIKSGTISSFEISNVRFKYGCNPEPVTLEKTMKIKLN